jgi:hypothetical protein
VYPRPELKVVKPWKVLADTSEKSVAILVPSTLWRHCQIPRRGTLVRAVVGNVVTVVGVEVVVASVATAVASEEKIECLDDRCGVVHARRGRFG